MNALDLKTRDGRTVVDIAMAPLVERNVELFVVDGGARGGMHDVPASLAAHVHMLGFEPNQAEFAKLVAHTTEAQRQGFVPPRWKKEEFRDVALWDKAETRPLYITNDTGAISLMGEIKAKVCDHIYHNFSKDRGGRGADVFAPLSEFRKTLSIEQIKCDSLDSILAGAGTVDYLKLDVEGAETRALQGARELFEARKVLFVKTEFQCLSIYEESGSLFGPQLVLLHDHGFRMLDFSTGSHWLYSRCSSRIPKSIDRELILTGDAYLTLDPDRVSMSETDLQRLGVLSLALGFRSFGLSLLRDAELLGTTELAQIEAALSRVRARRKLRRAWERFPDRVARLLYSPARHLRARRGAR